MAKSLQELDRILTAINGKGYKAYKDIQGTYKEQNFLIHIDYVQGDPFASPSRIRVAVSGREAGFPAELYDTFYKKRALVDFLSRMVARNIKRVYEHTGGTGKSGLIAVGHCGQEILERNYIVIDQERVEVRLEVGLPAVGRRILGKEAKYIFLEAVPRIAASSLFYTAIPKEELSRQIQLAEDQYYIRSELKKRNLVAFVANGSILPRESGVSQKPLRKNVVPFQSPKQYEIELHLPHRGSLKGMGIPEGVTLIVGGGFHGKSTLLEALELGVYDHIAGDGREYIATVENAVKIKAESGRNVEKVNISPFINHLPMKQDTVRFSTENASGSTSQAANIMEALEIGTDLLLIDEDTSATNFMIRDIKMQKLVQKEKEPITPFIDQVRKLYEQQGVSTILVIGGSGDYFEVADHVIMMDEYVPRDVTREAKEIVQTLGQPRMPEGCDFHKSNSARVLLKASFPKGRQGAKIKARGIDRISYNNTDIVLRDLEQLIDTNQTNTICFMLQYIMEKLTDDKTTMAEIVDRLYQHITEYGLDSISPYRGHPGNMALPRRQELAGALNRFRLLKIK